MIVVRAPSTLQVKFNASSLNHLVVAFPLTTLFLRSAPPVHLPTQCLKASRRREKNFLARDGLAVTELAAVVSG